MFVFKTPFGSKAKVTVVNVKGLNARSEAVFDVLTANDVFGDLDSARLAAERESFKAAVKGQALDGDDQSSLELTYPNARIVINAHVFAGEAHYSRVMTYPLNSDSVNKKLNSEILGALGEFAAW